MMNFLTGMLKARQAREEQERKARRMLADAIAESVRKEITDAQETTVRFWNGEPVDNLTHEQLLAAFHEIAAMYERQCRDDARKRKGVRPWPRA